MKRRMVILLGLISCYVLPMEFLSKSFLGTITQQQTQQSRPMVETQPQKMDPIMIPQTGGPVTLNVNIAPHMTLNAATANNIETNSHSESLSHAQATAAAKAQANVEVSQAMWNAYREPMQTFWDDNKLALGASALFALYTYYFCQVIGGNLYLKRNDLWSSWKNGLSFDQLCAIPQQVLARELILSIQHQGLDMQKPTDFTIPLVSFLQVIEEERTALLYYQTLYSRIVMVKCGILFPFNEKRYSQIESRLQRLSFVKNIFISWMAEFNLEHAKFLPGQAPLA